MTLMIDEQPNDGSRRAIRGERYWFASAVEASPHDTGLHRMIFIAPRSPKARAVHAEPRRGRVPLQSSWGGRGEDRVADDVAEDAALVRQPRRHEPQRRGAPRAGRSLRLVCSWASDRRAITRACEKAFPPPADVVAEGKAAVRAWRKAHAFLGQHGIHTSFTTPRARGSDGSSDLRQLRPHSGTQVAPRSRLTDEVYAERDLQHVAAIMTQRDHDADGV